jgi:hypothetical protein
MNLGTLIENFFSVREGIIFSATMEWMDLVNERIPKKVKYAVIKYLRYSAEIF